MGEAKIYNTSFEISYKKTRTPHDKKWVNDLANEFRTNPYFNNINDLINKINNEADYVLLINVLHEIPPIEWKKLFESISKLLKDSGKLIIVEREELTIGESPYDEGFLMITKSGSEKLFGKNNVKLLRHPQKHHIVKYVVSKEGLFIDS